MLRIHPRINRRFPHELFKRSVGSALDLRARQDATLSAHAQLGGDDLRRDGMIAGDHERAYTCVLRFRNGVRSLLARRIDHADQAQEHQIAFQVLVDLFAIESISRQQPQCDAERTQAFARKSLVEFQYLGPPFSSQRPFLLAHFFLRAARKQHIRRTLGELEQVLLALGVAVHRAHQLALGRERDLRNALEACTQHFIAETRLARRDDQGAFGRIALHGPTAVLLLQHGVVRAIGCCKRSHELALQRPLDRAALFSFDRPFGCIACSAEADAAARSDQSTHGHFIPGERAGLVGSDDSRRTQGFHGREMAHDGIALRHPLHTERQHCGNDGRQAFGHRSDRQRHTKNEHLEECAEPSHLLDQKDRHDHDHGDCDHDDAEYPADARQLFLQRRRLGRCALEHPGDRAHLRVHSRRYDDGAATPMSH